MPANADNPPAGYSYSLGKIIRGGGDYVERNGLTLATLIERINQQLANQNSTEKLVIIGPSMGGQISRYALKWMENNNKNHNVRLWVSFDSNHGGTVLPIGEQFIIRDLAGVTNEIRKALDRQLNSAHAKQSLVDHHLYHVGGQQNAGGAPGFHNTYYNIMDNLGWPLQCRKIAMISGAENGAELPIPKATELAMRLNLKFKTWTRLLLVGGCAYICARVSPYLAPLCGLYCAIQSKKLLEASMYTAPGPNQTGRVSRIKIPLILLDRSNYVTGGTLTRSQSIETVQSGFYWGYKELTSKTDLGFFGNLIKLEIDMPAGYHSHQPTGNTLAYGKGINGNNYNFKWDDDVSGYDLVCEGYIPFDYYYGPKYFSVKHDSLFYYQARKLIDEINGIISPPNTPPGPEIIRTYLNNDCSSVQLTLNAPPGFCYNWETTGGLLIDGSPSPLICGLKTVTISGDQGTNGKVKVRRQNSTSCFTEYTQLCFDPCITWENPNFRWIWSSPAPGEPLQAEVDPFPGALFYQWYVNGSLIETTTGTFLSTYNWPCVYEGEGLTVLAVTECGRSATVWGGTYSPICYLRHSMNELRIFPNPGYEIITLAIKQEQLSKKVKRITEIRFINKMGREVFIRKTGLFSEAVQISISHLPADVYTVLVFDGNRWHSGKFVKK